MSRFWATASISNYLLFDEGSNSAKAFPYFYGAFAKFISVTDRAVICHSGGNSNRRGFFRAANTAVRFFEASTTNQVKDSPAGVLSVDVWIPILAVVRSATDRSVYWGSSANRADSSGDQGATLENRYTYLGVQANAAASLAGQFEGRIARAFRVEGDEPTDGEIDVWMSGADQAHDLWTCYGSWPLLGDDLTDHSGNGRTLSVVGTVAESADEPFPLDELEADDVESSSEVSSPAAGQVHALLAGDVESLSEVTVVSLGSGLVPSTLTVMARFSETEALTAMFSSTETLSARFSETETIRGRF